jgi:hypothetical protein
MEEELERPLADVVRRAEPRLEAAARVARERPADVQAPVEAAAGREPGDAVHDPRRDAARVTAGLSAGPTVPAE